MSSWLRSPAPPPSLLRRRYFARCGALKDALGPLSPLGLRLSVLRRYAPDGDRAATIAALRELNAADAKRLGDRSLESLAASIDEAVEQLALLAPLLPLEAEVPFHLGLEVTMSAAWANLLAEFAVHGFDVATAIGRPWTWPTAELEGVWRALMPAATGWLRAPAATIDELWAVELPFGTVTIWIHDGRVTVDDAPRPADHTIRTTDPARLTLAFPFRRILPDDAAVALLSSRFHDI